MNLRQKKIKDWERLQSEEEMLGKKDKEYEQWRSAQVALKASGPVGVSPVSLCPQVFISTKELPYVPACNTASGCSISPHTHNHQQPWQHSLSLSYSLTLSHERSSWAAKHFVNVFFLRLVWPQ